MPDYQATNEFQHGAPALTGVLVVNLGTPASASAGDVRRFLKQFLSDPRVVEYPRWLWWLILNGIILRIRPARSAEAYEKIWTERGSPLMLHSQAIAAGVAERLRKSHPGAVCVELGMSYGDPSIPDAIDRLRAAGARRLLVLPLYPQYSGTTTASVFDAVTRHLQQLRWVPETRFINQFHDEDGYIAALANTVREHWSQHGRGARLLFSFHGVPRYTLDGGDPYHCQCQKTARLVAESLGLGEKEWVLSFQSRVGREVWLRPYTDETVRQLGQQGLESLDVICPGFSTDCLETLEEIAMQNAEFFAEAGGGALRYIPALNARSDHLDFLASLAGRHMLGWPSTAEDDPQSRERALAMGSAQ